MFLIIQGHLESVRDPLDSNTQAEGITGHEAEIISGQDATISIGDVTLQAIPLGIDSE
jgi:hypothetical protein